LRRPQTAQRLRELLDALVAHAEQLRPAEEEAHDRCGRSAGARSGD
jgi:hypothetical protein